MKSNRRKVIASTAAIICMLALAGFVVWRISHSVGKDTPIAGTITLGYVDGEFASGVHIAEDLNLFARNGVNVHLRPYDAGIEAYNAMLNGEVDMCGPTEYVMAGAALRHENVRIISTLVKLDAFFIVARPDHGIENISDLIGKKVGISRSTISEFIFGRFLDLHGIPVEQVTPVNLNMSEAPWSLKNGTVDAIVTLPPYLDSLERTFGDSMIKFPAQSSQWIHGVLISTVDWISRNPDMIIKFLTALDQAHTYMTIHTKEAAQMTAKHFNVDGATVDMIFQRNSFSLSLDQSLIAAMEDEARWMMANNLAAEKTMPDFGRFIYVDGLKAVKPEAVSIIR